MHNCGLLHRDEGGWVRAGHLTVVYRTDVGLAVVLFHDDGRLARLAWLAGIYVHVLEPWYQSIPLIAPPVRSRASHRIAAFLSPLLGSICLIHHVPWTPLVRHSAARSASIHR